MRRKNRMEPMPDRFKPLALYNSERARGLVHTEEWQMKMAILQKDFNYWSDHAHYKAGYEKFVTSEMSNTVMWIAPK